MELFYEISVEFIYYHHYSLSEEFIMSEQMNVEDTCCKLTCCADGCCSDGCKTGECSTNCCSDGCCSDSDNCC